MGGAVDHHPQGAKAPGGEGDDLATGFQRRGTERRSHSSAAIEAQRDLRDVPIEVSRLRLDECDVVRRGGRREAHLPPLATGVSEDAGPPRCVEVAVER